jgi:hypothetical protein
VKTCPQTASVGAGNRIILVRVVGAAALGGCFCAVCLFLWLLVGRTSVVVDEPNRVFNDLVPLRHYDVDFRVHNQTNRTLRVVGMGIT